jgi:hypothetical protein
MNNLFITYRGDEYKVNYNPHIDDLEFGIKVNMGHHLDIDKNMEKFSYLRNYLKEEGFFPEFFSKQEEPF